MDVMSRTTPSSPPSTLNPNAPMFVPLAYRTVDDFSDEWWALVQSSPWFRDYWLQERFHDPQNDPSFSDIDDPLLPDDLFFDDYNNDDHDHHHTTKQVGEERDCYKDLVAFGAFKWQKGRAVAKVPRYAEKAPKIVNVKVSPRMIQQPR